MGVTVRAARSRELIAKGKRPAVVARMLQVNRSGLYRTPKRRPAAARWPLTDPVDRLIVEVARANPTDGTRMVAALASRELGRQVNRKRAQRVMRMERLLQRHRPLRRRRRPGFFQVERPDQLWHLDMTSVWVAEHGWTYLNAAIDCCTREIVGWNLELRCRTEEAITLVDQAVVGRGIEPGYLTLGTDNGSAFTSRGFRARLAEHGISHRRGGYRDPESQAFIESWFGKLKERLVWRSEFETLDQARKEITAYIHSYHHRPHSGLRYRTPAEVRRTWEDGQRLVKSAA
jgi:putative transposase